MNRRLKKQSIRLTVKNSSRKRYRKNFLAKSSLLKIDNKWWIVSAFGKAKWRVTHGQKLAEEPHRISGFQYYVDPLVSFPSSSSFSHMKSSLLRDNKKDDGPRILGARNVTCCRKIHEISSKEEEKNGATRNHSRNRASFLAISKHVSVMRNVSKEYISFPHSARTFEIRRFNDRIFL